MTATIKDVAKMAGVSVATVSRVLNDSAVVSPEAAESVRKAVDALGYSPNFLGRNLRKCKTHIILAVLPTILKSIYSDIVDGMQTAAAESGYEVLLSTDNTVTDYEMKTLKMLDNRIADAAVLLGTHLSGEKLEELSKKQCIGLCCERTTSDKILTVTVDNVSAAYSAVELLIKRGHKRIGMISTENRILSSVDREKGYMNALELTGIPFKEEYLWRGEYDWTSGSDAIAYFMSLKEPPTAVFAISDDLAIGAIAETKRRGISAGKDFPIIGFDNIPYSAMNSPSISTVSQPGFLMGETVVMKIIYKLTEKHDCNDQILLPYEMVLRESTGD